MSSMNYVPGSLSTNTNEAPDSSAAFCKRGLFHSPSMSKPTNVKVLFGVVTLDMFG